MTLVAIIAGCEPRPAVSPPPPPAATAARPAIEPLGTGTWGEFASKRFEMRLPLPDGRAWRIDDHSEPWLVAAHAPSSSELVVRVWGVPGTATRARCEEEARMRRKLPERERADIVERRPAGAPEGFDTVLEAGVIAPISTSTRAGGAKRPAAPAPADAPLRGFVVAFGGRGRRCFAYAYTTSASGPGAEQLVGERLATMAQGSLGKLTVENDLAPHLGREPGPAPSGPPPSR